MAANVQEEKDEVEALFHREYLSAVKEFSCRKMIGDDPSPDTMRALRFGEALIRSMTPGEFVSLASRTLKESLP